MVRVLVASLHGFLALLLAAQGVVFLWQGALNRSWEVGFYGQTSFPTQLMLAAAGLSALLGVMLAGSAVAFALRKRWGDYAVLGAGLLMLLAVPPLRLVGMITVAVVFLDLWATRARLARRDE